MRDGRNAADRLIVMVHGTERRAQPYSDAMADFAEANRCAILAPLFPVSPAGDGNADGYKYLAEGNIRYDHILIDMVAELGELADATFHRFGLFGFSGGGHFAHRFLLLHPERLWAACIGAPGGVTLIDPDTDWWAGTRDVPAIFGTSIDADAIASVPVHLVIGSEDTAPFAYNPSSPNFNAAAAAYGRNRMERLDSLFRNLTQHGVKVGRTIVPGAAHDGLAMLDAARSFFHSRIDR